MDRERFSFDSIFFDFSVLEFLEIILDPSALPRALRPRHEYQIVDVPHRRGFFLEAEHQSLQFTVELWVFIELSVVKFGIWIDIREQREAIGFRWSDPSDLEELTNMLIVRQTKESIESRSELFPFESVKVWML